MKKCVINGYKQVPISEGWGESPDVCSVQHCLRNTGAATPALFHKCAYSFCRLIQKTPVPLLEVSYMRLAGAEQTADQEGSSGGCCRKE